MSSTDAVFDARFGRRFAAITGVVPAALLLWDAWHGQLGVNSVNYAIRTTGLLGLIYLTLTLLVTPVRRLFGWNALLGARRALGLLGFSYIALHFLIFFWWDRDRSLTSTFDEILERPYLTIGFGALVLMIPLAITSTDAMVRRLGAKRWKLLHRAAYLIVLGGVVHYYLLVKADTRQPRAFAIVLGALMAFRLVDHYLSLRRAARQPRRGAGAAPAAAPKKPRFWTGELVVARVFAETPDVRTFRLAPVGGGELPFDYQPGQYLNLALTIGGRRVNRSYTIASSPSRTGYVEITVKRKQGGWGSHHVHDAFVEGALVKVGAPAGRFTFTGAGADRVLLLSGGVGITPVMAMLRWLTDRAWTGQIYFVTSVRTPADVIFADELAYLAARFPNLHLVITATATADGDGWTGRRGQITAELLREHVPELARTPVYLCGPEPMMIAMRALLTSEGVPVDAIHTEAFVSPPTPAADEPDALVLDEPAPPALLGDRLVPIRFQRSGKSGELSGDRTVLEAAEDAGLDLPFECRSGICGQCKCKLVSGNVTMDVQDALSSAERAQGYILACQARPAGDRPLAIDA